MKKLFLASIIFGAIFTSCKKTTCDVPVAPVDLSGTIFKGNFSVSATINLSLSLTFNADGTMVAVVGGTGNHPGTWNKSPNSNLVNFIYEASATSKNKGSGTLNAENNKITGTLFSVASPNNLSNFSLDKQ
jgi:hypothetical protein